MRVPTYTGRRIVATVGIWLLRLARWVLQLSADAGQIVVLSVQVYETRKTGPEVVWEDETAFVEAVMSRIARDDGRGN